MGHARGEHRPGWAGSTAVPVSAVAAAASLFYTGYQAARFGSRAINVAAIPNAEEWAYNYCVEHPGRPAVEAFRQAYRQTLR